MVLQEQTSRTSAAQTVPQQRSPQQQSLPSPALCCACGLCIMLAGINITLVGAFAFGTFIPTDNPPIIIGPLLLLIASAFFTACCLGSRRAPANMAIQAKGHEKWGLMHMGTAVFEIETSEHTLQDTTAVQFSPTNSPSISQKSNSSRGDAAGAAATAKPSAPAAIGQMHESALAANSVCEEEPIVTSESKESPSLQITPDRSTPTT